MRLFSEHPGATMSMVADERLRALLREVVSERHIDVALETGTFRGQGSSMMIADLLAQQREPRFLTIEADWSFWREANANLSSYGFVECYWGHSVPIEEAIAFMQRDEALLHHERYPEIFIDDVADPLAFYTRECRGELSRQTFPNSVEESDESRSQYAGDDLLRRLLRELHDCEPLVLLDSAGGIGLLEFRITMETLSEVPFTLLLDDVHHLKHFRSLAEVRADWRFQLLGADEYAGWALALYRPT